jgi:hypothetical protein
LVLVRLHPTTTIATKVDHSIVNENANGVINIVGGDKPDIVMEKEKVANEMLNEGAMTGFDSILIVIPK